MQDIQATLDDKRTGKASKTAVAQPKSKTVSIEQTPTAVTDVGQGQQRTESAEIAAPKLSSVPQPAANSPCMAKADLKEFVTAQSNAITGVLALNPGQKGEPGRMAYHWPTRTMGSQVGGSLTKLTSQEIFGVGQKTCGSAFRLGNKTGRKDNK